MIIERLNPPEARTEMWSCLQMPIDEQGHFNAEQQSFPADQYTRIVYLGEVSACDGYSGLFVCYLSEEPGYFHIWRGKLNGGVI